MSVTYEPSGKNTLSATVAKRNYILVQEDKLFWAKEIEDSKVLRTESFEDEDVAFVVLNKWQQEYLATLSAGRGSISKLLDWFFDKVT